MTIRAAVFAFLDQHDKPFRFSYIGLEVIVCKYTKLDNVRRKHVMACVREYCDISGASLKCTNRQYGYYHFTPGVKVSKAIVD